MVYNNSNSTISSLINHKVLLYNYSFNIVITKIINFKTVLLNQPVW